MSAPPILLTLQPLPHPLFNPDYYKMPRYLRVVFGLGSAVLLLVFLPDSFVLLSLYLLPFGLEAINHRCFLCCKPIEVVFTPTEVRIKRHRFWRKAVQEEILPFSECTAVVSYFQTGAIDGLQNEVCTVLLRQAHQTPIVLDWHGRQVLKTISLKSLPPSDMPSATELRATISQATGLRDAGFIGKSNLNDVYFSAQSNRNKSI